MAFSAASCSSSAALLLLLLLTASSAASDLAADRSALLALRAAVAGRTVLWDAASASPCAWAGVTCENDRVAVLRLPGDSLTGQIPLGIFPNLTALRTLSLRFNTRLTGPLPSDLGQCVALRNVYLQGNAFSGEIPAFFHDRLNDLVRLNLAGNRFTGEVPVGFNKLVRLRTLYLQDNLLSGTISALDLPNIDQFNVSNNQLLNGSIPRSLRKIDKSSFAGTSLCGRPLNLCPGEVDEADSVIPSKKKLSAGAIAGIVIGSVVALIILLLLLLLIFRRNSSQKTRSVDVAAVAKEAELEPQADKSALEAGNGVAAAAVAPAAYNKAAAVNGGVGSKKLVFFGAVPKAFDLEDLLKASAEVLGKGTFGTAYKAVLDAGITMAVKRLRDVTLPEKEFREKIEAVGAVDHENLVPLRAYYYNRDEKLLVYDYMPMGSLSALLHGNRGAGRVPLNWEMRSGIALGAARGIAYLHSQGSSVSHGNIKSSNILLDKSYEPRVSDFGLSQLSGPSSTPNRVDGYRAPEVTDPRKVSQKADVYSFGVLLLELLTGKAPTHALLTEEGVDLPRWAQSVVREEWTSEVFDFELLRNQNAEEEMVQLLQLAIDCAAQYPDKRPPMSEVARRIEELRRSSLEDFQDSVSETVRDVDIDNAPGPQ
uniref:Protein kinase domain-containing protein n=1 Tax=Kalanchoe fedtschenkoi TaxID=63787 RepID=A0A7N0RDE2_KALFE